MAQGMKNIALLALAFVAVVGAVAWGSSQRQEAIVANKEVQRLEQDLASRDLSIARSEHAKDSIQAVLDSARKAFPPMPVIVQKQQQFFQFAPLQLAVDSLNAAP